VDSQTTPHRHYTAEKNNNVLSADANERDKAIEREKTSSERANQVNAQKKTNTVSIDRAKKQ